MIIDVTDIRLEDLRAYVTRADGARVNFSELVTSVTLNDHVNTAAVEVGFELAGEANEVSQIGLEGSSVLLVSPMVDIESGEIRRSEIFRGTITTSTDEDMAGSQDQVSRQFTCHDLLWYWKSEGDFVFRNQTLSAIFRSICSEYDVPIGDVTDTTERLGTVVGRGSTLWDVMQEALQRHADLTGEVFRVNAQRGRVSLSQQGNQDHWWVFERSRNLREFRRTRSIDEIKNDVKVYGVYEGELDKPKVVSRFGDDRSQELYGTITHVEYLPTTEETDRVNKAAKQILDRHSKPDSQIEISGWVVSNLRAGDQVRLINRNLGVSARYYVETMEVTWRQGDAQTYALCREDPVEPDLILTDVVAS